MALIIPVKRPKSITVKYQDFTGESKETKVDGLTARIIQQGIDRLNGIDFKTKVSKLVQISESVETNYTDEDEKKLHEVNREVKILLTSLEAKNAKDKV